MQREEEEEKEGALWRDSLRAKKKKLTMRETLHEEEESKKVFAGRERELAKR